MATAQLAGGDETANARDFVTDRLRDADGPMSPAELATEYGCTNGHVRNVLSDLMDEGEVERVQWGKYTDADAQESGGEVGFLGDGEPVSEDHAEEDAPADFQQAGGRPSEDHDTTDEGDREDSEMPTDEELDRQRSQLVEDGDDQEGADDQLEDRGDHADGPDGELPGIPIEAVAVAVVVAFGVYWFVIRDTGSDDEDEQQAQQGQQTAPDEFGGLVEGV